MYHHISIPAFVIIMTMAVFATASAAISIHDHNQESAIYYGLTALILAVIAWLINSLYNQEVRK